MGCHPSKRGTEPLDAALEIDTHVASLMDITITEAIEQKTADINKNLINIQEIVADHLKREAMMGQYLGELQQERPEEGLVRTW